VESVRDHKEKEKGRKLSKKRAPSPTSELAVEKKGNFDEKEKVLSKGTPKASRQGRRRHRLRKNHLQIPQEGTKGSASSVLFPKTFLRKKESDETPGLGKEPPLNLK